MWNIELPKNERRVAQLQEKLREYYGRLGLKESVPKDPEPTVAVETIERKDTALSGIDTSKIGDDQIDTVYKLVILEQLLTKGAISGWIIIDQMKKLFGPRFKALQFETAFAVIIDYCRTGGARVKGGTGLR